MRDHHKLCTMSTARNERYTSATDPRQGNDDKTIEYYSHLRSLPLPEALVNQENYELKA